MEGFFVALNTYKINKSLTINYLTINKAKRHPNWHRWSKTINKMITILLFVAILVSWWFIFKSIDWFEKI
jgi:ABC-type uncharacterized transport system permease subunit